MVNPIVVIGFYLVDYKVLRETSNGRSLIWSDSFIFGYYCSRHERQECWCLCTKNERVESGKGNVSLFKESMSG